VIAEWFFALVAGIWDVMGAIFPDWDVPAELTDPGGGIETMVNAGAGAGVWVNWPFVITVALIPPAVWVIGILWKLFRTLISHIPGFGGAG